MFSLTNLELLGLRENGISSLSRKIGSLSCLLQLDVSYNEIRNVPKKIGALRNLKILDLRSNKISRLPLKFGSLKSLRVLHLEGNRLKTLPATFSNLKKLDELNLSNNKFERFPDCLPNSLLVLGLSRNRVSEFPPRIDLYTLCLLNLSGNKLNALSESLEGFETLKELDLSRNSFSVVPFVLERLKYLRALDLCENPLKSMSIGSILIRGIVYSPIESVKKRAEPYLKACEERLRWHIIDKRYKSANRLLEQILPYLPLLAGDKALKRERTFDVEFFEEFGEYDIVISKLRYLLGIYPEDCALYWHLLELYDESDQIELAKEVFNEFRKSKVMLLVPLKKDYLRLWQKIGSETKKYYDTATALVSIVSKFAKLADESSNSDTCFSIISKRLLILMIRVFVYFIITLAVVQKRIIIIR